MSEELERLIAEADQLFRARRLTEAEERYRQIIVLQPDLAPAYSRLGAVLAMQDRLTEAEAILMQALSLDPQLASAHSNLGNLAFTRGDYTLALERYQEAIRLDPENPTYYDNLHAAYKKLGQIDQAVAAYKRARKLEGQRHRQEAEQRLTNMKRRLGCLAPATLLMALLGLLTVIW